MKEQGCGQNRAPDPTDLRSQDDNEAARKIFLAVLERAPDTELANATLFHLAEVYGLEQRYLTQLETLRTVGRLGHVVRVGEAGVAGRCQHPLQLLLGKRRMQHDVGEDILMAVVVDPAGNRIGIIENPHFQETAASSNE